MKKIEVGSLVGLSLFLILIASCTAPVTLPATISATISATKANLMYTPTTTLTISPATPTLRIVTPTPRTPPTSEPIATYKPTSTDGRTVTQDAIPLCSSLGVPISPPDGFGIAGTIVYEDSNGLGLYTIGGTPLAHSQLPVPTTQENIVFGFSPDGEWLAYAPVVRKSTLERGVTESGDHRTITGTIVLEDPAVTLLSASGERLERTFDIAGIEVYAKGQQWPESYLRWIFGSWINNRLWHTVLFFDDPTDPYSTGLSYNRIYDPFAGEWFDEPLESLDRFIEQQGVAFSPDMSRALYAAKSDDALAGVVLQDMDNNGIIWSDPDFEAYPVVIIQWSPDSSVVAVSKWYWSLEEDQILLISRDGTVNVIANPSPQSLGHIVFAWSPDGRYLAIVISDQEREIVHYIYMYDAVEGHYLYSCPLVAFNEYEPGMIWSPDSTYIALSGHGPDSSLHLLDVQTTKVIALNQNAVAVGWSNKFPTLWP